MAEQPAVEGVYAVNVNVAFVPAGPIGGMYPSMFNEAPAVVERARMLLAAHCTAEQRRGWEEQGWLAPVFGRQGGVFGFGSWAAAAHGPSKELFYQVWEFDAQTGEKRFRWCVLPQGAYGGTLPEFDCILGVKLLLEADEAAFRAIARVQWDWRTHGKQAEQQQAMPQQMNAAYQAQWLAYQGQLGQLQQGQQPLQPYANADPAWLAQQQQQIQANAFHAYAQEQLRGPAYQAYQPVQQYGVQYQAAEQQQFMLVNGNWILAPAAR